MKSAWEALVSGDLRGLAEALGTPGLEKNNENKRHGEITKGTDGHAVGEDSTVEKRKDSEENET